MNKWENAENAPICKTCDGSKIVFWWGPTKRGFMTQASECPDCKLGKNLKKVKEKKK
jgi:cytochrome c1